MSVGGYGRKGRREGGKGEVRADASERIVWSVAVEKLMCTPCFRPSLRRSVISDHIPQHPASVTRWAHLR